MLTLILRNFMPILHSFFQLPGTVQGLKLVGVFKSIHDQFQFSCSIEAVSDPVLIEFRISLISPKKVSGNREKMSGISYQFYLIFYCFEVGKSQRSSLSWNSSQLSTQADKCYSYFIFIEVIQKEQKRNKIFFIQKDKKTIQQILTVSAELQFNQSGSRINLMSAPGNQSKKTHPQLFQMILVFFAFCKFQSGKLLDLDMSNHLNLLGFNCWNRTFRSWRR